MSSEQPIGKELRARIWENVCPFTGLKTKELERHVEAIATTIERTRATTTKPWWRRVA